MKAVDTHCHPQFPQFDRDREEMLKRAFNSNIGIICVGTDKKMSEAAIKLSEQHQIVWASVGLHPNDNLDERYDQKIYRKLAQHSKVVAIGEVGLDYFRTTEPEKKKFQRERFEQQIDLAVELDKPLIIHCRDAHADMLSILENRKNARGVIHSFTGTYEDAKRYVALGWHIGLNGITTFTDTLNEVIQHVPVDNILLETDAPYLTPVPFRGQRNEPSYVLEVAKRIADIRSMVLDQLLLKTTQNSLNLFGLSSFNNL
ncbi:MAG: TatD family hydrolase [Candidatus Yanofskybacteria bacterium]|nr:TatD family hydrolase [Candidatus Yanofskybacteria bacterium]